MNQKIVQSVANETKTGILEDMATTVIKEKQLNENGNEDLESMVEMDYVKVKCEAEQAATTVKEEVLDEYVEEKDNYIFLHTSIEIKEEDDIDSEHMIASKPTEFEIISRSHSEEKSSENSLERSETIKGTLSLGNSGDLLNESQHTELTNCVVSNKRFDCDFCDKVFTRKERLKSHLLTHSEVKPYNCDLCSKSFTRKDYLKSHLLTHSGKKSFKCSSCGRNFSQKHHLKNHLHSHSKEKPFKCALCKKEFTQKDRLRSHVLTHSGVKLFRCEYCEKTFSRRDHMKAHSLTHPGKKPFKCSSCDREFARKDYLKTHLLTHSSAK